VVRIAERPAADQPAFRQHARDRVDHAHLQRFRRIERRQQARQALRQHRLAGAGRSDHQQIVTAGGGNLDRPLRRLLPLDVGEVRIARVVGTQRRFRRRQRLRALEVVDQRQQAGGCQHLDAGGPRRLAALRLGADQAERPRGRVHCRRQHARHSGQRAVQPQFAQRHVAGDLVPGQRTHRRQQAERDRQVEVAAFLEQVGRRQIDGDPARRQRQPHRRKRRTHPLPALGDRLVRQSDDRKRRQTGCDVHLHVDIQHIDALKRHGMDSRDHDGSCSRAAVGKWLR
jgi:hypothetical protein